MSFANEMLRCHAVDASNIKPGVLLESKTPTLLVSRYQHSREARFGWICGVELFEVDWLLIGHPFPVSPEIRRSTSRPESGGRVST